MTRQDACKKIIAYLKKDKEHYTIEKVVEDSYDGDDLQCSQIYLEPMNPTIIGWLREDLNQMFPHDSEDVVVTLENNREYTSLYARIINIYDADVYYVDDAGDNTLREGDAGAGAVCTSGAGGASSVSAMAPENVTACVVTGMNPKKNKKKDDKEKMSETRKRLEARKRLNERLAEAVKEDKVDEYLKKRELPKRVLYNGSEDYEKLRKSWLEGKDAKKRYEKTLPLIDDGNPSHNPIGEVNMNDRYNDGQVDQFLSWYESHQKNVDPVKVVGDVGRPRRKRDSIEARRRGRLQERRIDKTHVESLNLGRVEKYVRNFPGIKNYDMNSRYLDVEFEDRRIEINFYNGLSQYCYEISMVNIVDQNGYKFKWRGASTEEFEIDFENAVNLDIELEMKDNLKERRVYIRGGQGNVVQKVMRWIKEGAKDNVTVDWKESLNGRRIEAKFPDSKYIMYIYNLDAMDNSEYKIKIIDVNTYDDEARFIGSVEDLSELKQDVDDAVKYCIE